MLVSGNHTAAMLKYLVVSVVGLLCSWLLTGCCDADGRKQEMNDWAEENGVDVIGGLDDYRVTLTEIECRETDDGFFGGNEDELTVTITCGRQKASLYLQMTAGGIKSEACPNRGIGSGLFGSGGMALQCRNGDSVKIALSEDDDFSPTDTGANTVGWNLISSLTLGAPVKFGVAVRSTSTWDKIGDWFLDNVGLCATDFIPFAKAGKFSTAAKKFLKKKAKAAIRAGAASLMDEKISEEPEDGDWKTDPKGYVLEKFNQIQCVQTTQGQYMVKLEFFGVAHCFSSLMLSALCVVFVVFRP